MKQTELVRSDEALTLVVSAQARRLLGEEVDKRLKALADALGIATSEIVVR